MRAGDAQRTATLLGAIKALLPQFTLLKDRVGKKHYDPLLETALKVLGEEAFDRAWNLGQHMQVEKLVALACTELPENINP